MTSLQSIEQRVAQIEAVAEIETAVSIGPRDNIEHCPLWHREIDLTARKGIDLESGNGLSEYSRAGPWIRRSRNRGNRVGNVNIRSAGHGLSPKSTLRQYSLQ